SRDAGEQKVRIVATVPATAGMFRVDQLVTALARERVCLTDAYYAGTAAYVQALRAAAGSGVDVRLLVPNSTDIPLLQPLSRAGAGAVRIGNAVGAAVTDRRTLQPVESRLTATVAVLLLAFAVLFALFPRVLAGPVVVVLAWFGAALLYKSYQLQRHRKRHNR